MYCSRMQYIHKILNRAETVVLRLFGSEPFSTQGDIAGADIFNVTRTGSSILYHFVNFRKKGSYSIGVKPPVGYSRNMLFPHNAKS